MRGKQTISICGMILLNNLLLQRALRGVDGER